MWGGPKCWLGPLQRREAGAQGRPWVHRLPGSDIGVPRVQGAGTASAPHLGPPPWDPVLGEVFISDWGSLGRQALYGDFANKDLSVTASSHVTLLTPPSTVTCKANKMQHCRSRSASLSAERLLPSRCRQVGSNQLRTILTGLDASSVDAH